MNIFCLNKSQALKTVIKKKFSSAVVGRLVGAMASRLVSDKAFMRVLGERIMLMVPERLNEIGVTAQVDVAFSWESFLVVEIAILHADARKLIKKRGGKEKAEKFDKLMDLFGSRSMERFC